MGDAIGVNAATRTVSVSHPITHQKFTAAFKTIADAERVRARVLGALEAAAEMHDLIVWALGDCTAVPKPHGGTYAPLAQNAVREGPLLARNILARNILARLSRKPTQPFRYEELGQMASLGNRRAIAELPGGRMLTGLPAWLLWRTYYLARLPGLRNKVRVALDWTLNQADAARR